ncbi:Barstar [compost metagenome]
MDFVILNGKEIYTVEDLHAVLKAKLHFPDYYGENLDALWDCLSEWTSPLKIEWRNFRESEAKLGTYASDVKQLFNELEEELHGLFEINIIP